MTAVGKPLADALYRTFLQALPWYMKITKAQRFRWECTAHQAAFQVEQMRSNLQVTADWPVHAPSGVPCLRCTMIVGTRRDHP